MGMHGLQVLQRTRILASGECQLIVEVKVGGGLTPYRCVIAVTQAMHGHFIFGAFRAARMAPCLNIPSPISLETSRTFPSASAS